MTIDSLTPATRWVAVGSSADADPRIAGAAAAEQAVHGRANAKLLIVFASEAHATPALLDGIADRAPGVPLIGCSTAGEITGEGPADAGVVVMALGGEGFAAVTASADQSIGGRAAGAQVADGVAALEDKSHSVMLLLSDALAGDQQEVIRGAYGVLGAGVPLVGGCAGDGFKMAGTYQFHGDQVLRGAVVGALLGTDAPFGVGVSHGWAKVGEPVLVTRSAGNRVYELDDRPALDVYLERLGAPEAARSDSAAFAEFGILHPLGLDRRSGEQAVRFVAGADFDERSLTMIAEVPQGGLAWFMRGDAASVQSATDDACAAALAALGEREPLALIAFDCAARRGVLGDEGIVDEVGRIAEHAGDVPVAGFYSYGEIVRTSGVPGFHNQTLVVLALS